MIAVLQAYLRALRSFSQPAILWHLLWPTLLAFVLWGVIAWWAWDQVAALVARAFAELAWLHDIALRWEASSWIAALLVNIVLTLLLIPLVYGTALFIVAVFALPLMIDRVGARDYADLERRRGGTLWGSAWNALVAVVLFMLGWIVTLPLWLIPGVGLFLPLLLAAYLNQRAYRYDVLAEHADRQELRALIAREKGNLYLMGLVAGLLAYIPVLNLIAPAYAALAFVHYCLNALRHYRRGETERTLW